MNMKSIKGSRIWLSLVMALTMALTSVASAPASAQELAPEHLALARKYIDLTGNPALYLISLATVAARTESTITALNPDLSEPLGKAITTTLDFYKDRKGDLLDQIARFYATVFTMEELQQIVDFYSTPTGMKLSKANVDMGRDLQAIVKVFEKNLDKEFYAKVRAILKEQGFSV